MQVPMGILGDKAGIRLAFMLNATSTIFYWGCTAIVGSQQNFPFWGFYLSPAFIFLGGGPWVTGTLVFAAVSDSVKPEQRTAAFSIIEAISGIADLVGPIFGTMTMTIHLGIPFALALVVFSLMFFPASHLRENTVSDMEGVRSSQDETESLLSVDSASDREETDSEHTARHLLPPRAVIFGSKGFHELFDTLGVFAFWRDYGPGMLAH
ncbi:hypothetical protein H9Q73_007797 [Fusarium xylarioides]|nr:hypothetical protein H9Q73_007797 [Fusarium xylarioides]